MAEPSAPAVAPQRFSARFSLLATLLVAAVGAGCGGDSRYLVCDSKPGTVAAFELFETSCEVLLDAENPFDPKQLDLWSEYTAPDGAVVATPAFVSQDFSRELVGGTEKLVPSGGLVWKARFTPTRPGAWKWRWRTEVKGVVEASSWRSFEVTDAAPDAHGFLRVSPTDRRYLRYDDGAPYFAVGENLAWYDQRGTFAYDAWLDRLGAQGVNYARLWMPSWAFGLEWRDSLGNYTSRLDRAWQLDQVLAAASQRGVRVMLSLLNHGAFSKSFNSEWADNPYNKANGGPLDTPEQFFTSPTAKELFKRRLRYIVARWGYSPDLLAWELWNEVDLTLQYDGEKLAAWHTEMAGYLRSLDPNAHLVTTSVQGSVASLFKLDDALFGLEAVDFAQLHLYGMAGNDPDFTTVIPEAIAGYAKYGKPVLASEIGVDMTGPAETLARDPHSSGFHDALWSGLFAGTFGSGMSWWWDNLVDPQDLYFHFGPLSAFTRGVAFDQEGFASGGATADASGRPLTAMALRGQSTTLVWIKNPQNLWFQRFDDSPVSGAVLTLKGLAPGDYTARWINTYGGESPAATTVAAPDGEAQLVVPTFAMDVALRLEHVL